MTTAAFASALRVAGDSVPFTDEPTDELVAGEVYQIADEAMRVLNPSEPVVVAVGGIDADPADYVVDYLFGRITFIDDPGDDVTVSGEYLELDESVSAREFSISISGELADATEFSPDGYVQRQATISDASGSITSLTPVLGGTSIYEARADGRPILLEVNVGGTGELFRAWVLIESLSDATSPAALHTSTINWQAAPVEGLDSRQAAFAIGS